MLIDKFHDNSNFQCIKSHAPKQMASYATETRRGSTSNKTKGSVLTAVHYKWLAIAALLLTVYLSAVPCRFQPTSFDQAVETLRNMRFAPFSLLGPRSDWVATIVQLAVLSFLAMAALCVDTPWDVGIGGAVIVIVLCALLSVVLEFLQIFFPPRTVSWNDILLGSLGGVVGSFLWLGVGQRFTNWFRRVWTAKDIRTWATHLLPGYIVFLFVFELAPFDLVVSLQELGVKNQQGRIWLLPFCHSPRSLFELGTKTFTHTMLFLPLGFLKAFSLGNHSRNQLFRRLLLSGLALTAIIEFLQLFIYSRNCDTTDIIIGAAAVLLGGWLAWICQAGWPYRKPVVLARLQEAYRGWQSAFFAGAIVLWLAIVLYLNWSPFTFTADPADFTKGTGATDTVGLQRMNWFPIADYYWTNKYYAFTQIALKTVLFLPLGVLLAVHQRPVRSRRDYLFPIAIALVIGAIIQLGQCYLPDRLPGTTDIFTFALAAWFGFAGTKRLRRLLQNTTKCDMLHHLRAGC